jgi:hypothetical protein
VVSHATEVADGIHRLTNGVANFYLIQEPGKLVLVDADTPTDWHCSPRQPPGGKDPSSTAAARIAVPARNSRWARARTPWPTGKGASQQGGQPCDGQACAA